ncbi:hypothetical protein NQ036_11375 [Brevibacterium sp. 91QC2O2]|uniref:hypothetical protein n=1 Tax=Brevibacterium TaxID=1696 RepID=UPI00211C6005|nr:MULTISPECIES: hypothetical protein [unclassified Brevibacterium]MCQ9368838.1 hypothetical protein [Brevibacterium sp. 91QC2O2]MCQ9386590.1 hypothetical protein [Brevibacterium sp. 68QC2CO]
MNQQNPKPSRPSDGPANNSSTGGETSEDARLAEAADRFVQARAREQEHTPVTGERLAGLSRGAKGGEPR